MTNLIDIETVMKALEYRHACRVFDTGTKITDRDIQLFVEAARLAPSSFGMEQWNLIVAQNSKLRAQLKQHAAANATKFDTASHIFIFTAKTVQSLDTHIDHMLRDNKGMDEAKAARFKTGWEKWAQDSFKLFAEDGARHQWAARQAYIALGFVMLVAAERGIDSCAMEGFSIDETAQVLADFGLINPNRDLPVVMLALGYRAGQQPERVRRTIDEVVRWY